MVDGVNFNPFTGKVLTTEEIQKLDENKDGIVSNDELTAGMSWLSETQDSEGDVEIPEEGEQPPKEPAPELDTRGEGIYNAAIEHGATDTANTTQELAANLTKIESQYIEKVLTEKGITDSTEISQIVSYLKNQKVEFLNNYINENPEGPYEMEAVAAAYIQKMDEAFASRQESVGELNGKIEDMKANAGNFDDLYAQVGNNGSYMDPDEFAALKDKATSYILGQMLNGEMDTEFLSSINPNYTQDSNYITAMNAIKSMQSASDPEKMQEYLDKAEAAISKFLGYQNTDGTSKLANAINATHQKGVDAENAEKQEAYKQELTQFIAEAEDQYIEKAMSADSSSSQLVVYLKEASAEFLANYLKENPEGPYDLDAVSAAYTQAMDQALATRSDEIDNMNDSINDMKNSSGDFESLYATAMDKGSYVDAGEFQELKDEAIDYILGQMMNGEMDDEFLSALNKSYKHDANYNAALRAISALEGETDPAKIQELIAQAEEAMSKFIGGQNNDGTSKLQDAINAKNQSIIDAQKAAELAENKEEVSQYIDDLVENYSNNPDVSQEDIQKYSEHLNSIMNAFFEQYNPENGEDVEAEFKIYLNNAEKEYNKVMQEFSAGEPIDDIYNRLVDGVESAGSYVSDDEKAQIIDAATDLFVNTILTDGDTSKLKAIYPNYASNPDYIEAKQLLDNLYNSATPSEDYEKIKELLGQMIDNYGVDKISSAVKTEESKNVNLEPGSLTNGIWGYASNDTYGGDNIIITSFNIDDKGNVVWTNNNDKGDIEKVLNQLEDRIKAQLKEQLGDLYVEADIEKYFDEAVIQQLVNQAKNGDTTTVDDFVNGIIKEFNKIATDGLKGTNSNDGSIDRTQVLKDSGAVDDYASGEIRGGTHWKSSNAAKDVKNNARAKLEMLRSALVAQAQSVLGDAFVASDIDVMIDQAITDTVDSYDYWDTKGGIRERYAYNANEMYDNFFDNFEEKLNKYKQDKQ